MGKFSSSTRAGRSWNETSPTSWWAAIRAKSSGRIWPRFVLAAALGFGAGAIGVQRRREIAEGRAYPVGKGGLRRLGPLLLLVVVLLWFARSFEALVLVVAVSAVGALFNVLGRRTPQRLERYVPLPVLAGVLVAFFVVASFGGVGWNLWGGLLLTAFLAVAAILLSFPSACFSLSADGRPFPPSASCASPTSSSSAACP